MSCIYNPLWFITVVWAQQFLRGSPFIAQSDTWKLDLSLDLSHHRTLLYLGRYALTRGPTTPGPFNTPASCAQPVLGFLIDDLTSSSSPACHGLFRIFQCSVMPGVMKGSSSLSASQIVVSWGARLKIDWYCQETCWIIINKNYNVVSNGAWLMVLWCYYSICHCVSIFADIFTYTWSQNDIPRVPSVICMALQEISLNNACKNLLSNSIW